jgi:hypothetical protein
VTYTPPEAGQASGIEMGRIPGSVGSKSYAFRFRVLGLSHRQPFDLDRGVAPIINS